MSASRRTPGALLSGVLLGSMVALGGWLALLVGQLGEPVVTDQWVSQSYARKLSLADAIQKPRVLIVGGSGALFGLDSTVLAETLGRPVVNLGVNAGVQSQFIRRYAREAIRPGDWVILPLEYPLYHDRHSMNYAFNSYWLAHPGIRSLELSLVQLAKIVWLTSLSRVLEGYSGLPQGYRVEGLYGPHNINEQGDQVNSEAARQELWMREAVENSAVQQYGKQATQFQANWDRWEKLAQLIKVQGGCAVFIPPAMLDRPEYHAGIEREYYETLPDTARANGLNYWGDPLNFMYPMTHFFDTNYHLTAEARKLHTAKVASLLSDVMSDCRAVNQS